MMRGINARGMSGSQVSDWHNNSPQDVSIPSRGALVLPRGGLISWIAADSIAGVSDGDTLPATIADLSGVGNDATRASSPKYRESVTPNAGPAMSSEGVGYLTFPSGMWTGKAAGHLFCYMKAPSGVTRGAGPWQFGAGDYTFIPYENATTCYEGSLTTTRYTFTSSLSLRDVWRIFEVEADGTNYRIRIDGVTQVSEARAFAAPASGRLLANNYEISHFQVAEFAAYDKALTADEAASVRAYLVSRHGATG